ncbi:MAG TPA: thioesterase family protein [Magnetospirillaceae bacterium]|jgi:acyl-CoA thioesterase FadM
MNLWLRMLGVLIGTLFKPRLGFFDESVLRGHVWPTDIDLNIHMNNARYLAVMDLGRLDIFLRGSMIRTFIRKRWQPVMGAAVVRFRRSLRPFEAFTLHSRFIGWDERRCYMEHWIEVDGVVSCQAIMWAAFRNGGQRVSPETLARELGFNGPSPLLPAWVQSWRNLDDVIDDPIINNIANAAE